MSATPARPRCLLRLKRPELLIVIAALDVAATHASQPVAATYKRIATKLNQTLSTTTQPTKETP